jgi:hypothetical protein
LLLPGIAGLRVDDAGHQIAAAVKRHLPGRRQCGGR